MIEELGGLTGALPIPNSFPQSHEVREFSYVFVTTNIAREPAPDARWTQGTSIDGKGQFSFVHAQPIGGVPELGVPDPQTHAQTEQMMGADKSFIEKAKDVITGK